jgi:hypothetical protein
VSSGAYQGVALNSKVVNLCVHDSQGRVSVSSLLAALDWVLANRAARNIRVDNMSPVTTAVGAALTATPPPDAGPPRALSMLRRRVPVTRPNA